LFYALMQFSVAIASPFFAVYMLRDLQFSYAQIMANTGMSVLAQFLTLSQWGRISDAFGNRRVLAVTGLVLPLMPLLWVASPNFWYLLLTCWIRKRGPVKSTNSHFSGGVVTGGRSCIGFGL
jgi:MFS family permease